MTAVSTADSPPARFVEAPVTDERRDGGPSPSLSLLTGTAFAVLGLLVGLQSLHDNSFLTHLATGRLILRDGGIPRTDPYSFTAHGHGWVVQSWLASFIYTSAEKLGGVAGIRLVEGALVATTAALVWRLSRPATSLIPRILIAALACGIGIGLWVERPLMFGLIGFALLLVLVEGDGDLRWLLPIMWVWVNTHGSFPLGLGFLVLLVVGTRLDGRRPTRELHTLAWATGGTLLGAVNPLGVKLLTFPLTLLQKTQSFSEIQEWKPPAFNNPWQILFAVQLVVAAGLLLRSRRWRIVLPFVVFAGLGLTSARNIVPASLVLLPGMALGVRGLGSIDGDARPRTGKILLVGLVGLGLLLGVSSLRGPDTNLVPYPEQATTWLEDHHLLADRVVAPDYVGNYLEARYGDKASVFIDDRVDMYPVSVARDSVVLLHARPGAEAVLARRRAGVVLWPRSKPLTPVLRRSANWRIGYQDDRWVVFLPAQPR